MPSTVHEGLIHLFSNQPDLAITFLSGPLGVNLPPFEKADIGSADLTNHIPTEIPMLVNPVDACRSPELAVLSAVAHGGRAEGAKVLHAAVDAITSVDKDRGWVYYDTVLAALPTAARDYLEKLMTTMAYEFSSEFALRNQAEGETKALLAILDTRGIPVSDEIRDRILACRDLSQLEIWIRKAITVNSADELFA